MAAELLTSQRSELTQSCDVENQVNSRGCLRFLSDLTVRDGEVYEENARADSRWYRRFLDAGVEVNGIKPVPRELRTQNDPNKLFTVFFTCLLCILP